MTEEQLTNQNKTRLGEEVLKSSLHSISKTNSQLSWRSGNTIDIKKHKHEDEVVKD